jgi:hypothetical protein
MDAYKQWEFVVQTAEKFGVGPDARIKWRQRGVPHRWRLPLIKEATAARVKLDEAIFDDPPPARRERAMA